MDVMPRELISSCGSFITKGSNQFGIQQDGKDKIYFYVYTDKLYKAEGKLPDNWENNWHKLYAVYDGANLSLSIDGTQVATAQASGSIKNLPFPINVGRNEQEHGQETDVYICDAQIDNVGVFAQALPAHELNAAKAVLWLDFEKETLGEPYWSYGIGARTYGSIWPDRTPQPEMWQMKKTVQPLSFKAVDLQQGQIEVWNRNHFLNANYYDNRWELQADGQVIAGGNLDLNVEPLQKALVRVPFTKPSLEAGKEYFLVIRSFLKHDEMWAKAGYEVSWDQLELPWYLTPESAAPSAKQAHLEKTDEWLRVTGEGFAYTFTKNGVLNSICHHGNEWLKSPLKLNVWRAPLANEQDAWNSYRVMSPKWDRAYGMMLQTEYYTAGLDTLTYIPLSLHAYESNGKVMVEVRNFVKIGVSQQVRRDMYIFGAQYNGFEEMYSYVVDGDGTLQLTHTVNPQGTMPQWLPRIGLTLTLDKSLSQVNYFGRGPQANYPDRKTGYKVGVYQTDVDAMYEPYLIPQDYGLHTDSRWVKFSNQAGAGIQIRMNQLFNFNAYPYSTENLTRSVYPYQLQKQDGITLNLDYETSGVGCTARAIFPAYRVYPHEFVRSIIFKLTD